MPNHVTHATPLRSGGSRPALRIYGRQARRVPPLQVGQLWRLGASRYAQEVGRPQHHAVGIHHDACNLMLLEFNKCLHERSDTAMYIGMHGTPSALFQLDKRLMNVGWVVLTDVIKHLLYRRPHRRLGIRSQRLWIRAQEFLDPLLAGTAHAPCRTNQRLESRANQRGRGHVDLGACENHLTLRMLPNDLAEPSDEQRPRRVWGGQVIPQIGQRFVQPPSSLLKYLPFQSALLSLRGFNSCISSRKSESD